VTARAKRIQSWIDWLEDRANCHRSGAYRRDSSSATHTVSSVGCWTIEPLAARRATASTTGAGAWPQNARQMPSRKSMAWPSTSRKRAPCASVTQTGGCGKFRSATQGDGTPSGIELRARSRSAADRGCSTTNRRCSSASRDQTRSRSNPTASRMMSPALRGSLSLGSPPLRGCGGTSERGPRDAASVLRLPVFHPPSGSKPGIRCGRRPLRKGASSLSPCPGQSGNFWGEVTRREPSAEQKSKRALPKRLVTLPIRVSVR
jgi:hypothetical protein